MIHSIFILRFLWLDMSDPKTVRNLTLIERDKQFYKRIKMNKQGLLLLIFSLILLNGHAAVSDNLQLVWNDEFNGNTLDASKWAPAPEWPRQGGSFWSNDNYEMTGNGQVKLSVTEKNGTVYCGAIRTHNKFDKKYGYFEVRCKVPQLRGGWAAFWMMPYGNNPGDQGNDGTEIDVFESINGWQGKINHALHWDGYADQHQKESYRFDRPDLYDNAYHKFGVMWTPQEYIFYIDDVETWRTSAGGVADVNQYLKLTMEVASGWWAGNWSDQVTKPIHWLVDYVRVYDYQPITQQNVSLDFTLLENNQQYEIGDQVEMHVDVSGNLSEIDEIRFYTQKGSEPETLRKTSTVTNETTYWYNWFPNEAGTFTLKAKGFKNGVYVTNVVSNATISGLSEPLNLSFTSLNSGEIFAVGDQVNMDILLSGDLSDADQLQYLVKKGDAEFVLQTTINVSQANTYAYNWVPSEAATYSLRVTAFINGQYVTHAVVGGIVVEPAEITDPLSLRFISLISGGNYTSGDLVNMDVELLGDLSDADELQFLAKNGNGEFVVQNTTNITGANTYNYTWTAGNSGTYSLRITALKNDQYITHTVVGGIVVEPLLDPLSINFATLSSGSVFQITDLVSMDINLFGDLLETDKLEFLVKKGDEAFALQHTVTTNGSAYYAYDWTPTEAGTYSLMVTASKNGGYITHVVVGSVVIEDPLSLAYNTLASGQVYNVGDQIKMHTTLSGDYTGIDQLKFLVKPNGGSWTVLKTSNIALDQTIYWNKWTPTEPGAFKLKVSAYSEGAYVTHIVANITVEDPITLSFKQIENGQIFNIGEDIKMHIGISGDFAQADRLDFVVQKSGEDNVVDKSVSLDPTKPTYYNKWVPSEPGLYALKGKAFLEGVYVTNVVANITVIHPAQTIVTSLNEADNLNIETSVYPNPVQEVLYILTGSEMVVFKVVDQTGNVLLEDIGKSIQVGALAPGSYFLVINGKPSSLFIKE